MPFQYPPLPATDGIRILTLQSADNGFNTRLTGTLTAVPFSDKPKYIALSYTWADQDEAHAQLPLPLTLHDSRSGFTDFITLNGEDFPIGHNLALALHYLRSDALPLHIWVDQICIDQSSIPERNAQVALMAFIFTRATAVVGWLGVAETRPPSGVELLDYMRLKWASGKGKQLARLASPPASRGGGGGGSGKTALWKPQFSDDRNGVTFVRDNPYWQRVWIVQEVCLPRTVVFLHGGFLWSQDQVRGSLGDGRVPGHPMEIFPAETLLSTRDERFSDAMSLEILVEKFADCGCSDLRDKIYGLLGLANDVESAPANSEAAARSQAPVSPVVDRKGRGTIIIDYTRSFWDIFCDVISFMSNWSSPRFEPCPSCPDQTDEERWVHIVRFAGVVQNALEGEVQEDAQNADPSAEKKFVVAKGYIAGEIQHIGPKYSQFVGSYAEEQAWISSWHDYYSNADDLSSLRKMEDEYAVKIIAYTESDLAHIQGYHRPRAIVWHAARSKSCPDYVPKVSVPPSPNDEPVRFLGTERCMGLAPPSAKPGDLVVRFWNCDAAVVVRQENKHAAKEMARLYGLVGRADIAEPWSREVGPDTVGRDYLSTHWESEGIEVFHDSSQFETATHKAVYIRMDYETLQKITADIIT